MSLSNQIAETGLYKPLERQVWNFETLLISDLDAVCKKIGRAASVKMRLKTLQGTVVDPEAIASAADIIALVQITNKRRALRPVGGPMENIKTHKTLTENSDNVATH